MSVWAELMGVGKTAARLLAVAPAGPMFGKGNRYCSIFSDKGEIWLGASIGPPREDRLPWRSASEGTLCTWMVWFGRRSTSKLAKKNVLLCASYNFGMDNGPPRKIPK